MDSNAQNNVEKDFVDTVKPFRSGAEQKYTHASQFNPKGKFFVPAPNTRQFFDKLCSSVQNGAKIGMMENYGDEMPIIVDNDFDFVKENMTTEHVQPILYEEWVVTEQIEAYNRSIEEYYQPEDDICYTCFVLEKPAGYLKKDKVHNGFHLHYPFAKTEANSQKVVLRPMVKKLLTEKKTLERMKYGADQNWDKVLDDGLPHKTWVMYGCRREEKMEPYRVTAIYDKHLNRVSLEEVINRAGLENLTYVKKGLISIEHFKTHDFSYYLPIFLSLYAWDYKVPLKPEIQTLLPSAIKNNKSLQRIKKPVAAPVDSFAAVKVQDITDLVKMLSSERANDYSTWIQVGWALNNITNNSQQGLEIWEEFSKKSPKFAADPSCCERLWGGMEKGSLSMGSLRFWAKKDSPEAYKEWNKTEETELMRKALGVFNHFDIAKFVHKMLGDNFVCASLKNKIWYEFKEHRWRISDSGVAIYSKLSTDVVQRFEKYRTELSHQAENTDDEEEKSRINARIEAIGKVTYKLKDVGVKEKIMKELAVLFFDPTFLSKLDDDPDLLCTPTGILDLKLRVLRPGIPEDYCSKCTGVAFNPNFTMESPEVKEMLEYLRKVFPSEGVRKYILRYCSSVLRGGNSSKLLPQWYGPGGDNSKSMFTDFFVRTLGDYCIKFPATFLTAKSTSNGACTPELERAQGARIGFIQEPEGTLNISKAKEVTGGDSVYVRGLYKEGREIRMMMKWVIVCNKPLLIPAGETALFNRADLVPYEATFLRDHSKVPDSEEEQFRLKTFKADPFFQDKIPRLAPAFFWLIYQEFDNFLKEGLASARPQEIIDANAQYRADTDVYAHFIRDRFVERQGFKLSMVKIYKVFNVWFRLNFPSINTPTRIEMRDSLNRAFKNPHYFEVLENYDIKPEEEEDIVNRI